jgi:hypothetical protein
MKGEECTRVNSPAARGFAGGWLNTVRAALLSVVFPAGCRICEPLLTEATRIPICRNCLDSFAPMTETVCDKCGRPVESDWTSDDEVFVCPTGKNEAWRGYAFDRVRSWAVYEGALVRAILFLKFENIEPLGKLFSRWLAEIVKQGGPAFEADVIVRCRCIASASGNAATTRPRWSPDRWLNSSGCPTNPGCSPGSPASRQVLVKLRRKVGSGAWRFCHTSRQPS